MASTPSPSFESPVVRRYREAAVDAALTLRDASSVTKLIVRAGAGSAAAGAIGVPFGSSRSVSAGSDQGEVLILGQRPGEFLVLGAADAARSYVDGLDRSGHVSVIDHTHSRAMFRLTGADAARVLEKVSSVDWSDAMTPDGAVVSASVAKTGCDLARDDAATGEGDSGGASGKTPSYLIACDRSFGQYLFDAILDAGAEFAIAVRS